jgi:hypothetical protein
MWERLIGIAYDAHAAREAVQMYALDVIASGLAYVKRNAWRIENPAGYLRCWLNHQMVDRQTSTNQQSELANDLQENSNQNQTELPLASATGGLVDLILPTAPIAAIATLPTLPASAGFLEFAYAVEATTGCDLALHANGLGEVQQLYHAGYRADDVVYFLKEMWPRVWPGRNGEPPTLKHLKEHIGLAKHMLKMSLHSPGEELEYRLALLREHQANGQPIASLDNLHSVAPDNLDLDHINWLSDHPWRAHPRLSQRLEAAQVDREAQAVKVLPEQVRCAQCGQQVCRCAALEAMRQLPHTGLSAKDAWQATLGQLQIELNRSTYATWLRRIKLAGYEAGHIILEVPTAGEKTWIEQHLLSAVEEKFNQLLGYGRSKAATPDRVSLMVQICPGEELCDAG